MPFTPGQVIITEGKRSSLVSKLVAYFSKCWATHVFIVTGPDEAVEAVFPRVKVLKVSERLTELRAENRAYIVKDIPYLGGPKKLLVATAAKSFVGRWYDVWEVFLYALFRRFWNDGAGTLICSRLITAAYQTVGFEIFDESILRQWFLKENIHMEGLRRGFATPGDLLRSRLVTVQFVPSSHIRTPQDFFTTTSVRP